MLRLPYLSVTHMIEGKLTQYHVAALAVPRGIFEGKLTQYHVDQIAVKLAELFYVANKKREKQA